MASNTPTPIHLPREFFHTYKGTLDPDRGGLPEEFRDRLGGSCTTTVSTRSTGRPSWRRSSGSSSPDSGRFRGPGRRRRPAPLVAAQPPLPPLDATARDVLDGSSARPSCGSRHGDLAQRPVPVVRPATRRRGSAQRSRWRRRRTFDALDTLPDGPERTRRSGPSPTSPNGSSAFSVIGSAPAFRPTSPCARRPSSGATIANINSTTCAGMPCSAAPSPPPTTPSIAAAPPGLDGRPSDEPLSPAAPSSGPRQELDQAETGEGRRSIIHAPDSICRWILPRFPRGRPLARYGHGPRPTRPLRRHRPGPRQGVEIGSCDLPSGRCRRYRRRPAGARCIHPMVAGGSTCGDCVTSI